MSTPIATVDRYELYEQLASGGMGSVHLARVMGSVGFTRTVAIKRLHRHFATDPEFVSSFVDEARLAARIRHPNVVPMLDVVATRGELYLVMEYVHGDSLSRIFKTAAARPNERIPVRIVTSVIVGALLGLHAAHDARNERGEPLRIVHRDVSPHNLMVGADGHARVLDFGIAKAVGRLRTTGRDVPDIRGKLAYLAPEQGLGGDVDQRTDVFAAAIVLWELLCNRRLFAADNEGAVADRVLRMPIARPSEHSPEVSRALDAIVLRGLARSPADRWPTARAFALALEDAVTPATALQVGAWVSRVASETLAKRANKIAEMESQVTSDRLSSVLDEIRATNQEDEKTERMK